MVIKVVINIDYNGGDMVMVVVMVMMVIVNDVVMKLTMVVW